MSRRTKIIIAILGIALLIAIAVFLYFYFFGASATTPSAGEFPTTPDLGQTPTETIPTPIGEGGKGPRLVKLADGPVAGAVTGKVQGNLVVRYLESASGNAFEVAVETLSRRRLTNTTIPKVEEVLWNKAGSALIARYLKDDNETIVSFVATIKPGVAEAPGELVGSFLPAKIESVSASPSGKEFAYLRKEGTHATLIVAPFSGSPKTEVFRSDLLEWTPLWFRDSTIALLSKPSALANGLLLFINRATGASETVLSGIPGLTALPSPTGERIFISASSATAFTAGVFNRKSNTSIDITPPTLPEKCVFEKNGVTLICGVPTALPRATYPDAWYQGSISFNDEFWELSSANGIAKLLLATSEPLDLVSPQLNADETHLIFINKKDGSLWSFRIEE